MQTNNEDDQEQLMFVIQEALHRLGIVDENEEQIMNLVKLHAQNAKVPSPSSPFRRSLNSLVERNMGTVLSLSTSDAVVDEVATRKQIIKKKLNQIQFATSKKNLSKESSGSINNNKARIDAVALYYDESVSANLKSGSEGAIEEATVSMVQRNPSRTYIIRTESFLERERQEREMKRELERLEKEKMDKVAKLFEELYDSETRYYKGLDAVVTEFVIPLRGILSTEDKPATPKGSKFFGKIGMKEADTTALFSNVEHLSYISKGFLGDIKVVIDNWPNGLNIPFTNLVGMLSGYKQYAANWNSAMEVLERFKKNPAFINFLNKGESSSGQALMYLLSLPLTRIPQYELFLQDILSSLPFTNSEHSSIRHAYQHVKELTKELESLRFKSKNDANILRLMRKIVKLDGSLFEQDRYIVFEDEVQFTLSKDGKRYNGDMVLFNDIVMLARSRPYSNKQKFKAKIPLEHTRLDTAENDVHIDCKVAFKLAVSECLQDGTPEQLIYINTPSSEKRDKWVMHIKDVLKAIRNNKVFEISLATLMERQANMTDSPPIPIFLYKLFNYLHEKALSEEGIFRISASIAQIQHYKQEANKGRDIEFHDPHLAAAMLKQFFRDLPDVLVTRELRPWFLELGGTTTPTDAKLHFSLYATVISKMPAVNREVLKELMRFLHALIQFSETNKMNANNLGVVFGPNIFQNSKTESDQTEMQCMSKAVSFMIANYTALFEQPRM